MRGWHWLFAAAVLAGASYWLDHWMPVDGALGAAWKGAGVGMLAVWAAAQARRTDGWLVAAALALGALGDVLLDTTGLTIGAVAFLAGHLVAVALYLRNRRGSLWLALLVAVLIANLSFWLPGDRAAAPGIALYALGLGAMTGTALVSRFLLAAFGALLFAVSDLLIFARLGPLAGSPLPDLLVWPTYFAGQALIAWSVVRGLRQVR